MLTAPRHLRSYTLIDWGHLELPAQSQHLDGHTSVCSDCPLAGRPPPPRRRPPRPLRCSSRKPVQLGPLSAHARGGVPCPCKADGAPHTPHPPEACPEGGHAPPSQDSERLASCPGPGSFLCSPEPSRLPFVHGQGPGRPQLRAPWRGKASIWCPVCPAGPALEPAASLLGESLVASTCSPSHWAQQGAGTCWGAEPAFREARLTRDQTPAPGWAEGWVPSAPGRPAAQGPRLSPSLSPPLSGHQCAGEMAQSRSFRGTAESWFADPWFGPVVRRLVRHSQPPPTIGVWTVRVPSRDF